MSAAVRDAVSRTVAASAPTSSTPQASATTAPAPAGAESTVNPSSLTSRVDPCRFRHSLAGVLHGDVGQLRPHLGQVQFVRPVEAREPGAGDHLEFRVSDAVREFQIREFPLPQRQLAAAQSAELEPPRAHDVVRHLPGQILPEAHALRRGSRVRGRTHAGMVD